MMATQEHEHSIARELRLSDQTQICQWNRCADLYGTTASLIELYFKLGTTRFILQSKDVFFFAISDIPHSSHITTS